jgi:molybdopterin-guanine dinucleotide biosynthesis protein A
MGDDVLGAVLAGGASDRMGCPKGTLRIEGVTFLERAVATLDLVCGEVVVCGGEVAPPGRPILPDVAAGAGPLSGVASALDHARGRPVLILAVDLPLVTAETVMRVMGPGPMSGQARMARVDGRIQPVCGVYAGDLASVARERLVSGDRSLMAFVRRVPHLTLVDITDGSLRNVNTPDDYTELVAGQVDDGAAGLS